MGWMRRQKDGLRESATKWAANLSFCTRCATRRIFPKLGQRGSVMASPRVGDRSSGLHCSAVAPGLQVDLNFLHIGQL
jgi:hypothetical protein